MKTALKQIYDRTVSTRDKEGTHFVLCWEDWVELWKKPLLPENYGRHAYAQTFSRQEFEFDSHRLSSHILQFVCPYMYLVMGT